MSFSFFKKKEAALKAVTKVFVNQQAKWEICKQLLKAEPATIFIAWFELTKIELKAVLGEDAKSNVLMAREAGFNLVKNGKVVFVERHPLRSKEQAFFEKLALEEVFIYCSLDEPFFMYFGGDKIASLIQSLQLSPLESIEHPMVDRAIKNAQEKIEKNLLMDQSARSQKDWMDRNVNRL